MIASSRSASEVETDSMMIVAFGRRGASSRTSWTPSAPLSWTSTRITSGWARTAASTASGAEPASATTVTSLPSRACRTAARSSAWSSTSITRTPEPPDRRPAAGGRGGARARPGTHPAPGGAGGRHARDRSPTLLRMGKRDAERNGRAAARCGCDRQPAADRLRALVHALASRAAARDRGVEPHAVIADREHHVTPTFLEPDHRTAGPRVLPHVVERLLDDAQQLDGNPGLDPRRVGNLALHPDPEAIGELVHVPLEQLPDWRARHVERADRRYGIARLGERLLERMPKVGAE